MTRIRVYSCSFLAVGLVLAAPAFGADTARIIYTKSFPHSVPEYVEISIDRSGVTTYKEAADDDPETFKLDAASTAGIFNLADRLGHFKTPLESGLKVANMGVKTFRWEDGDQKNEVKFNYSQDENAKILHDWFERITESERLLAVLRRAVLHDRLGVNDAVLAIQGSWRRLAAPEQFLPLLEQIAGNEAYIHMARERAAELIDAIHAIRPKSE